MTPVVDSGLSVLASVKVWQQIPCVSGVLVLVLGTEMSLSREMSVSILATSFLSSSSTTVMILNAVILAAITYL